MARLIKNTNLQHSTGPDRTAEALLGQAIQVSRPTLLLPQSTTEILFLVKGGRVRVTGLVGTVTVVCDATNPVAKITSGALNAAQTALVGTVVDVASTVSIASLQVGGTVFVEGDGSALVKANAGCVFAGINRGDWVAPAGEIYLTTGDNNLTGFLKWDLWYHPLDDNAYVEAVTIPTVKI